VLDGLRPIAFYLPQFHPTPYNDEWWGAGFTEWTNVAKARPLYPGQYQPRIPGELGFYDLRLEETRNAQAALAAEYGVHAFCYWHYWFGDGRRVLERPFHEVLTSGSPDFPFCLAWANQSWSGIWHGAPDRVLMEQQYLGEDDDRRHFDLLAPAFHDPRYVRVDGKPLFFVYLPNELPDPRGFVERWQNLATESGLPGLFLVGRSRYNWVPSDYDFDAAVISQINPPFRNRLRLDPRARLRPDWLLSRLALRTPGMPAVYSFPHWSPFVPQLLEEPERSYPMLVPNWDNTPRSGRRGIVYHGSTPELFEAQARSGVDLLRDRPPEHRLLFIQAWNEWAEGNYLEPDARFGRGYLEALRNALE
jgi:lipopolysaccharide biosynthesis protein